MPDILQALEEYGAPAPKQELFDWIKNRVIVPSAGTANGLCFWSLTLHNKLSAHNFYIQLIERTIDTNTRLLAFDQLIEQSAVVPWGEILCYFVQLLDDPRELISRFVPAHPDRDGSYDLHSIELGKRFLQKCNH